MIRNIWMVLYISGYLLGAIPGLIRSFFLKKDPVRYQAYCRKKIIGFSDRVLRRTGIRLTLRGLENVPDEPTLTVFNHQSYFDIFLLISHLPNTQSMIAKKELGKVPLLSDWMRAGHCLFLDRDSLRDGARIVNEAADLLKNGVNITVAPEGTRSKGGPMHPFKAGTFKIAYKAEAPILPVAIDGAYKLYEGNGNKLKPAEVTVTVLPPIPTKGLTREEQRELPRLVQEKIQNVLDHKE